MSGSKDSDSLISKLNTPERLKRIDNFRISTDMHFSDGKNHVSFRCSEDILIFPDIMVRINNIITQNLTNHGEDCLIVLDSQLTKFFRSMLLYCKVRFEGEGNPDHVLTSNQILQLDDGTLRIFEKEEN